MQDSPRTIDHASSAAKRSNYRRAIFVSVVFHVLLIGILLFMYVPVRKREDDSRAMAATNLADASNRSAANQPPPIPPPPPASPDIPRPQIEASIESQIREADRLSDERKLSELEKNLSRLQSISTEKSVNEVTATIATTLGLEPGPVPAENPPPGDLDPDTVQIQDVQRKRGESGQWEYTSILVDAQGRTRSVPMDAAQGETVFNTFEQMKRFPIAAGIYRQVVMPMIHQMIEASEFAEQTAAEAERMKRNDEDATTSPDTLP